MPRYRLIPVEVEAVQWTGDNREEVEALDPEHATYYRFTNSFLIDTPETASTCDQVGVGDYVVKMPDGTLRKRTDEEFYATYEPVDTQSAAVWAEKGNHHR